MQNKTAFDNILSNAIDHDLQNAFTSFANINQFLKERGQDFQLLGLAQEGFCDLCDHDGEVLILKQNNYQPIGRNIIYLCPVHFDNILSWEGEE